MLIFYPKKFCKIVLAVVIFCSYPLYSGQDTPNSGFKKYSVISERNIFSRYKLTAAEIEGGVKSAPQKRILSLYVLRGVSLQGDVGLAFIEDEIGGEHLRLKVGDNIAGCCIKEITPNYIVCEKEGLEHTVKIGSELIRTESQAAPSQKAAGLSEKNVNINSDSKAGGGEDDVAKKMMERRKTQVSK